MAVKIRFGRVSQNRKVLFGGTVTVFAVGLLASTAMADVYQLAPIEVVAGREHPSASVRAKVQNSFTASRSSSTTSGSQINNLNPLNALDALKFTTPGLINSPGEDRFGGGNRIRTFGNFGGADSIDGLPAVKFGGEEGGGFSNVRIPSIAIEQMSALKGGRAVQYGDGTDGGILRTNIKSGRGYDNHAAVSFDINTADERVAQGEFADSTQFWDVYFAGRGFIGDYDGEPANLKSQDIYGAVAKIGLNSSDNTRLELMAIDNRSDTVIFRPAGSTTTNDITSEFLFLSATLDHAFSDTTSMRAGYLYTSSPTLWQARDRERDLITGTSFAELYRTQALTDAIDSFATLGAEYKRTNNLRDKISPIPERQFDNTFDDYAIKGGLALTIHDNLKVSAGLRHTWLNNEIVRGGIKQPDTLRKDALLSWEAGASYSVLDNTRIRGSVASGFNRFYEKYGNFGSDSLNPAGAGDTPVESITYEAGINQGWSTGYVDVAVYNTKQDNVPFRSGGLTENVTVDQSGIEVDAFWQISERVAAQAGYMHILNLDAKRNGVDVNANIFWGSQVSPVPENQVTLQLTYQVTEDFSVWGAGLYNAGFVRENRNGVVTQSRASERIDLGAAWAINDHAALRFRAENITDEKDFGRTLEGAPVDTSGRIGRVFWAGLDYKF